MAGLREEFAVEKLAEQASCRAVDEAADAAEDHAWPVEDIRLLAPIPPRR